MFYKTLYKALFLIVMVLLLCWPQFIWGQFYHGSNMTFGKNRVQYNEQLWTYYNYDDFDTYFYLNGKELALYAAMPRSNCLCLSESLKLCWTTGSSL